MGTGWCLWITGLPGSGKSTVSENLHKLLGEKGIRAQLLTSDALRKVITPKPTYTVEERDMVYEVLVYTAKLLTKSGVNVIIDATGNLRRYREDARTEILRFAEAYLECPIETCIERETERLETRLAPKRIYARALSGETLTVPGIGQPYEKPLSPEIVVDTMQQDPNEGARKILEFVLTEFKDL